MKQYGFTFIEVMVVIVIIGVLTSIALPMYTRTIERTRAVEAMASVKAINDAVYVYYTDKEKCPTKFSQLVVTLPLTDPSKIRTSKVETKFFYFALQGKKAPVIPGTTCKGAAAARINGGDYYYAIYNPYRAIAGEATSLACTPLGSATQKKKSQKICESLGMYISLHDITH